MHPVFVLFLAFAAMEAVLWIAAVRWLCTGKSPRLMRRSLTSRINAFTWTAIASLDLALVALSPQPYPWHSLVIIAAKQEWTYDGSIVAAVVVGVASAWCVERWYRRRAGFDPRPGTTSTPTLPGAVSQLSPRWQVVDLRGRFHSHRESPLPPDRDLAIWHTSGTTQPS